MIYNCYYLLCYSLSLKVAVNAEGAKEERQLGI